MTRWGVDRQLIDTKGYDEARGALDELLCSLHAMREEFQDLKEMGITLSVDESFCEDLETEAEKIRDEIETAEQEKIDSVRPDHTDFK